MVGRLSAVSRPFTRAWEVEKRGAAGVRRPRLSVDDGRDIVWTMCSLAVHDLLVVGRGWSSERYQQWLTAALTCELLPAGRA
jgi:hypothetical protein